MFGRHFKGFWHSRPVGWLDRALARASGYLWYKRYGRGYHNDFWDQVGPPPTGPARYGGDN